MAEPPKKLNDAADGDGELVAPEIEPVLDCSNRPIELLLLGAGRLRSDCCVMLCAREWFRDCEWGAVNPLREPVMECAREWATLAPIEPYPSLP